MASVYASSLSEDVSAFDANTTRLISGHLLSADDLGTSGLFCYVILLVTWPDIIPFGRWLASRTTRRQQSR